MDIIIADKSHTIHAQTICEAIEAAAQVRGTGIAKRSVDYIISKMETHNAVIALEGSTFAGFCYIETWSHDKFVANSGLIVHPDFRNLGLAKKIKEIVFNHSRKKFPDSKIFLRVSSINISHASEQISVDPYHHQLLCFLISGRLSLSISTLISSALYLRPRETV